MMGILVAFSTQTAVSFFKINGSMPFENFEAITSYNPQDHTLVANGTYDRHIRCNLIDFRVLMSSAGKIIVLTRKDLKVAPPAAVDPGDDIPISMELHLPETIANGRWNPAYVGHYVCKSGLFTSHKMQELISNSIIINRQ